MAAEYSAAGACSIVASFHASRSWALVEVNLAGLAWNARSFWVHGLLDQTVFEEVEARDLRREPGRTWLQTDHERIGLSAELAGADLQG